MKTSSKLSCVTKDHFQFPLSDLADRLLLLNIYSIPGKGMNVSTDWLSGRVSIGSFTKGSVL